jgi:hypothetical protein
MKNKFELFGITAIVALIGMILAGCASMQLVSLDTAEGPKQVRQGMDINPKDITVYGIYKDESRKTINMKSDYIVFDKHTPGPQTVKLRISGKEISFETEVMPLLSLAVSAVSQTTELYTGDTPDPKWPYLEIRGEWDQMGRGKIDTASCQITGYDKEKAGNQTITVSFEGKTTAFNINVAQSHPLKGTWSEPGPAHMIQSYTFNNDGTYEVYTSGENSGGISKGTYTTSDGKITMTTTQLHGRLYREYGCLSIMYYTKEQMETSLRATEAGKQMTDEQINATLNRVYTSSTRDYAINGDKLSFDGGREYVKR